MGFSRQDDWSGLPSTLGGHKPKGRNNLSLGKGDIKHNKLNIYIERDIDIDIDI